MAEGESKKSESKKSEAPKSAEPEAPAYDRDRLSRESDVLLNNEYPGYVVAGALTQLKGSGPVTADEARQAVTDFLNHEVQEV